MALDGGDGKPVFGKIIFNVEYFKQKADQLFCRSRLAQQAKYHVVYRFESGKVDVCIQISLLF